MITAGRVRLVDYSDSEGDDDIHNNEGIAPPPHAQGDAPPPETENELAKIVIELQKKYIREYEEIQRRQEEWREEIRKWQVGFEGKWELQRRLLVDVIPKVTGMRIGEMLGREGILSAADATNEARIPAPPIATPPATAPTAPGWGQGPARAEVTVTESEASIDEGPEPIATAVPTQPQRTRSTGKKAPRAEVPSSLRRLNQAARKIGKSADSRQQDVTEPHNPYDNPKYCSPLTITDECGNQKPLFKFKPTPDTVEELWAEYRHGLHGQAPVEQLEVKYRAKWRNDTYGRSWFTRRKPFWDKMKQMLADGKTEDEALEVMRALAKGSVPGLMGRLCKERAGKGLRPRKRKASHSLSETERARGDSEDTNGSPAEETDDDLEVGRLNPVVLRKRIRMLKVGELSNNNETRTNSGCDDNYEPLED
ncbi:Protein MSN1 [Colletotrichum siamense]|uniref:Protein MSN1 n=1 Tax=Colletotrichum siamense TaxID=690259 RepID=UPI001872E9C6|nr:Protein MSN1 [Colletotrichum siamense]KAF5484402.1 Protein MSN1 [Colletotrichum siamense]